MERWKFIEGFNNLYQISDYGNVKSIRNNKLLKFSGTVYNSVILSVNGIKKSLRVNILVATYFVPNPENKSQVNHIDGNKKNNYYLNVEWNTPSENGIHCHEILKKNNKTTKKVVDIITNKEYRSINYAAKCLKMNKGTLHFMLMGKVPNKTNLELA